MLESLLAFTFRATTMPYDELLIAFENLIIDTVASPDSQKQED